MLVRVALFLHEVPDGSSHVDLLIARDGSEPPDDARVVPAWRVAERPDLAPAGRVLELDRMADHRGLYLRLDVPRVLSGDRGKVTPLRHGHAVRQGMQLRLRWEDGGTGVWHLDDSGDTHRLRIESANNGDESDPPASRTTPDAHRTPSAPPQSSPP